MKNNLTNRDFWVNYWENKKNLAFNIPADYLFSKHLSALIQRHQIKSAIELGGFPGYYAIYLKKYHHLKSTLLDFFVHMPITKDILLQNKLKETDIQVIEADLFTYVGTEQYDLVLSCGLIEHFEDTQDIIKRHVDFLKPNGVLFLTLPNFKSVNGWFQRKFDKENYDKHNIKSMDLQLLKSICVGLDLKDIQVSYYGKFSVWLEPEKKHSAGVIILKKATWLLGKIFTKLVPIEHPALAPYIVLQAIKKD